MRQKLTKHRPEIVHTLPVEETTNVKPSLVTTDT